MCATAATVDTLSMDDTSVRQSERPASELDTSREVIRCRACKLNQFMTLSGNCRRCKVGFVAKPPVKVEIAEIIIPPAATRVVGESGGLTFNARLATAIWMLRSAAGMSQSDLEKHTGINRHRISAFENGRHTPSLVTFSKMMTALGVDFVASLAMIEAMA